VTGGPASGEVLQTSLADDDELEVDEEVSGGDNDHFSLLGTTIKAFHLYVVSFFSFCFYIPLQMLVNMS